MMYKVVLLCYLLLLSILLSEAAPATNSWANKQTVTYSISSENYSKSKLVICYCREIIAKAFNTWAAVMPISFKQLAPDEPADIIVSYQSGDHGDGSPFNEIVLAHGIPYRYIHLNYAVKWHLNEPGKPLDNSTIDMYKEVLFAIGQMLGLEISADPESAMYAHYHDPEDSDGNYVEPKLSKKDIENIQRLYGLPKPNSFTLFADEYEMGKNKAFTFYNDDSCHELKDFNDIASSIETNGHCIELFEDSFCEKRSVIIKPGCTDGSCCNAQTFVKCKFNDMASSYRACKSTCINVFVWITIVIVLLIIGFLLIGIAVPWVMEGLKVLAKKIKKMVEKKHYEIQAYLHPPRGKKKIAISQLKFIGIIGTGNSANVRLAHFYSDLNNTTEFLDVAVKTVKQHVSFSAIQKEIEIMEECSHENILKFVGWLQEGSHAHIVTEFMHGGSLHSYLRNDKNVPTIGQLFSYITQILDGMIYLGSINILHRDLAARNCLLNSTFETLKISDFGLARKSDNNREYLLQNDSELPFRWLPVEAFNAKEPYSIKGDVWAFGIVMWEIFERGRVPYKGMNVNEVAEFLKSGRRLPQPLYCSNEIYSIMLSCWDHEPKKRPEFETLKIYSNSIQRRAEFDVSPDPEYKHYYETPVKILEK